MSRNENNFFLSQIQCCVQISFELRIIHKKTVACIEYLMKESINVSALRESMRCFIRIKSLSKAYHFPHLNKID
jgi:hypothetical protein